MRADSPHPEAQRLLDTIEEFDVYPLSQYGAERAREMAARMRPDVDGPAVGDVTDRTIPGLDDAPDVPVRIYRPEGDGPFPTVVFFHGGGFVLGDLESHDLVCRKLTVESDCTVVAVDYRRAPEHPFPAATEDAYAATEWAAESPDELDGDGRLAVAGDSAGANLAAAASLIARDRGGPEIDYQALIYPVTSPSADWPSYEQNAEGYFLTQADMEWFDDCFFDSFVHDANPYAFPLAAGGHADLLPATVVTAGFDPLRDEGVAYAEALADACVPVEHRHYDDMIHGFFTMLAEPSRLETGHEAVETVAADLRGALD